MSGEETQAGQKRAKPDFSDHGSSLASPSDIDGAPSSTLSTLESLFFLNNHALWRDALLPLLHPVDLIRLMHTSKASRRVTAPL